MEDHKGSLSLSAFYDKMGVGGKRASPSSRGGLLTRRRQRGETVDDWTEGKTSRALSKNLKKKKKERHLAIRFSSSKNSSGSTKKGGGEKKKKELQSITLKRIEGKRKRGEERNR